jgi:hypothetical protein
MHRKLRILWIALLTCGTAAFILFALRGQAAGPVSEPQRMLAQDLTTTPTTTLTASPTITITGTVTPTGTITATVTLTPSPTPTGTITPPNTATPTQTPTGTPTATLAPLPTITLLFPNITPTETPALGEGSGEERLFFPGMPVEPPDGGGSGLPVHVELMGALIILIWILLGGFLVVYLRRLGI